MRNSPLTRLSRTLTWHTAMTCTAMATLAVIASCSRNATPEELDLRRHWADSIARNTRDVGRLQQLADSLQHAGDPLGENIILLQQGKVLRETNLFEEAIEVHRRGFDCASKAHDTLDMVQHLNNIGTNFRRLGMLEDASVYHYEALTLCEQYSDTTGYNARKNRVVSLNGIGNVQLTLGNEEEALGAFRAALRGETSLGSALV